MAQKPSKQFVFPPFKYFFSKNKFRQLVLKPGLGVKGGLWLCREKSPNFNSLRPILFELFKKTTGGVKFPPPSAGIGLISIMLALRLNIFDENIKQKISKAQMLETDMIFIFLEYNLSSQFP